MSIQNQAIILEQKLVGEINGTFVIPSYQRGYRWGRDEVFRLLEDVYTFGSASYSLQPVVVRKCDDHYELIDGQQRLTTIFLIYQYMHKASGGFMDAPKFSLHYRTRPQSETFLNALDEKRQEENIDFWFMYNAYKVIGEWFEAHEKKSTLTNINAYFDENVRVIWYEVGEDTEDMDAISLFTRLNIGKIPLTSAELVKALFLIQNDSSDLSRRKQEEIAQQWDAIERELHHEPFWSFLTNQPGENYPTRIDLLLDLITEKPADSKEKYYTFFKLDEERERTDSNALWNRIQHTFLTLRDWYENHEFYHKIGYLIAADKRTLRELLRMAEGMTKSGFRNELNREMRESIRLPDGLNYGDLSFEHDPKAISRLLLLFNVESVRCNGAQTQWFPFDQFKREAWSLEHIHAQHSEGMKDQKSWKEWLALHIPSVRSIAEDDALVLEMQQAIGAPKLEGDLFRALQERVLQLLSAEGSVVYLHSISNLALLNTCDNAALNNSTFDVKRNKIIEMDKQGQYIPFCTKMVFLKYYTPSEQNQLHFWGQADREAYAAEMNRVLAQYLQEEIVISREGN